MEGGATLSGKKAEATASYTYWIREASTDAAPLPVPKKIDPTDLCKQPNQAYLGSAGNRAGTWEEFFLNKWATDRIKNMMKMGSTRYVFSRFTISFVFSQFQNLMKMGRSQMMGSGYGSSFGIDGVPGLGSCYGSRFGGDGIPKLNEAD
ncbi:hypothetical protein ACS0TY_033004 [Phlomoides rotata]